jgi:hypothetical protein
LPASEIEAGGKKEANGTIKARADAAPGTYPLLLNITYHSTQADCSGSTKSCSNSSLFLVNVVVSPKPTYQLNCSFPGWNGSGTPAFFAFDEVEVRAGCIKDGSISECPSLNWTSNLAGAVLVPNFTQAGSSPKNSTLRLPGEPQQLSYASVAIKCADALECDATAECAFIFSPTPDNMTCSILNHRNIFAPNDSAEIQANCTKAASLAACPSLLWGTNITGASFEPNPTASAVLPRTNFTTTDAPVPQSGYINASSLHSRMNLSCNLPVAVENIGPDYKIEWIRVPPIIEPGYQFNVRVNVTNAGNLNATNTSYTALLAGNCSSLDQTKRIPGLKVGESDVASFTCTCSAPGIFTITAKADYYNNVAESDESNNEKSTIYSCLVPYAPACFDFV